MLEINGLVKYYGKTLAVDGVSFSVGDGEMLGLLGPNGAGKTTILRSVAGIVRVNGGSVAVDGHDLRTQEEQAKRKLAFVPEVPNMFDMLTVYEHIRFIAMAYDTMDGFEERADALLKRFDLLSKKNEFVISLSKGMKQKLAVICSFIHDARVFLFDEPLIGIDPKGVHELKDMMFSARDSGASILVSTHMLDTVERLCDRILIIDKGKKVAEGTLDELQGRAQVGGSASLEEVFLKLTMEAEDESNTVPAG